jgi:serine-type D-Ala-D-Ala carboxypeptidase (penicillin-binding protein 5/6)
MSRRGWVVAAAVATTVLVAGGGTVSAVRITAQPPAPAVQIDVPASYIPVPGPPPPVHQPPQGSLALQGLGQDIALLHADDARPIASVAKAMTAFAVLQAHPLQDNADPGAVLTMTDVDVQDWRATVAKDGSSLPVAAGERLSERQLLLGLLLPSANNFADTLARWTAGSVDAFVASLNRLAQQLGMVHTHFADPSGFSPETVSTASDLVRLGRAALDVPALMALAGTQHAELPDGTPLNNLDALLGTEPGWLGIKTGETPQAGGCLLFAVRRTVGDTVPVTLVGAVLGQTDLHAALDAARTAVDTGFAGYGVVQPGEAPPAKGEVTTRWGARSGLHVTSPDGGKPLAVRMGTVVALSTRVLVVPAGAAASSRVAVVSGSGGGTGRLQWDLVLDQELPGPSPWWMLFQN